MTTSSAMWLSVFLGLFLTVYSLGAAQPAGRSGTDIDLDINRHVYLLDAAQNTLRILDAEGKVIAEMGGPGWAEGSFDRPAGVWGRNGIDVFVADYGNHRIQRFDRNLAFVASLSTRESENPDERFGYPLDVTMSRMGDLFLIDGENVRILKIGGFDQVESAFGGYGAGKGRLNQPKEIEIGPHDQVYVLDGDRVVVFDTFGNYLSELGSGLLTTPTHMSADENGVIVLDGDSLRVFDAMGRAVAAMIPHAKGEEEITGIVSLSVNGRSIVALTSQGVAWLRDVRETAR